MSFLTLYNQKDIFYPIYLLNYKPLLRFFDKKLYLMGVFWVLYCGWGRLNPEQHGVDSVRIFKHPRVFFLLFNNPRFLGLFLVKSVLWIYSV